MPATTHYLDHAATTPMLPEAVAEVAAAQTEVGNASSLHTSGAEVVLTSGGTETSTAP